LETGAASSVIVDDGDKASIGRPVNSDVVAAWLGIATQTLPDLRDQWRSDRYLNAQHLGQMLRQRPLQAERGGGRQRLEDRPDGEWLHAVYQLGHGLDRYGLPASAPVVSRLQAVAKAGRPKKLRAGFLHPELWSCTRGGIPAASPFLLGPSRAVAA
jgi:hypothetical protein